MNNNTVINTNNNQYNICSLEHCYTNLFALTDLTGIKWIRLRAKEISSSFSGAGENKRNSTKSVPRAKKSNKDDGDEENENDSDDQNANDNDEDIDNDDNTNNEEKQTDDANEQGDVDSTENEGASGQKSKKLPPSSKQNNSNSSSIQASSNLKKRAAPPSQLKSSLLHTSSTNDPVLVTHAKCLNEDILCSWKRVQPSPSENASSNSTNKKKSFNKKNNYDEDDDDDDDGDDDENDDDNEDDSNNNEDKKQSKHSEVDSNEESHQIELNKLNDSKFKKELWIFWFEKEEPPHLRNLISSDLIAIDSQTNELMQQSNTTTNTQQQTANDIGKILNKAAYSSQNGLPYESRSMLFKALHNLIEKSLLEKGYARLGKWFVMPYNLSNINYSDSMLNSKMSNLKQNLFSFESGNGASEKVNLLNLNAVSGAGGGSGGDQKDLNLNEYIDVMSPLPLNQNEVVKPVGSFSENSYSEKIKSKLSPTTFSSDTNDLLLDSAKQHNSNGANNNEFNENNNEDSDNFNMTNSNYNEKYYGNVASNQNNDSVNKIDDGDNDDIGFKINNRMNNEEDEDNDNDTSTNNNNEDCDNVNNTSDNKDGDDDNINPNNISDINNDFGSMNKNNLQNFAFDESNHVSYSFSFFLHGASRVCTSVDIKIHKPIRLINKFDLIQLRNSMKKYFQFKSSYETTKINKNHTHKSKRKRPKSCFRGTSVILGPYGISARLIGYLANECVESKVTCLEWKQFYPLKLNPTIPNVLVIAGFDPENKLKFFYPNSFVYIVMDTENDDEEEETSILESELTDASEEVDFEYVNKKNKEEENAIDKDNDILDLLALFDEDANDSDTSSSCVDTDTSSCSSNSNDSEALKKFEASKQAYRGELKNLNNSANDSKALSLSNKKKNTLKSSFSSRNKKSHNHRDNTTSHSKSASSSSLGGNNSKSKENSKSTSDFFDTLDATIDSVARNYGTQQHQSHTGKDTSESATLNKSISICSPLSVTALSSPASSPLTIHANPHHQSVLNKTNSPISPSINSINDGTISSPKQRKPSVGSIGSPLKLGMIGHTLKREKSLVETINNQASLDTSLSESDTDKNRKRKKSLSTTSLLTQTKTASNTNEANTFSSLLDKNKKAKVRCEENLSEIDDFYDSINNNGTDSDQSETNDEEPNCASYTYLNRIKKKLNGSFLALDDKKLIAQSRKFYFLRKFLLNKKRFLLKLNKLRFNNLHNLIDFGKLNSEEAASFHNANTLLKLMHVKFLQQVKHQSLNKLKQNLRNENALTKKNIDVMHTKQFKNLLKHEYIPSAYYNAYINQKIKRLLVSQSSLQLSCFNCKRKNNSKLETQIQLKHKKFDLLNENLPLAFDLLDKCQMNICTSSICLENNGQNLACVRCSMLSNKSTGGGCNCVARSSSGNNPSANSTKTSPIVLANQKKQIKTEPFFNSDNILLTGNKQAAGKTSITTKIEPFHRRKCYFDHNIENDNKRSLNVKNNSVRITKTVKLGSTSSNLSKNSSNPLLSNKLLTGNAPTLNMQNLPQNSVSSSSLAHTNNNTVLIKLNNVKEENEPLANFYRDKIRNLNKNNMLDSLEDQQTKNDYVDEIDDQEQEIDETSNENILVDLDDIGDIIKSCDDCLDESNKKFGEDGQENYDYSNELTSLKEINSKFTSDAYQQKNNSNTQSYENLFLSTNLDTEYEDVSLSEENDQDYQDECGEEMITLTDLATNKKTRSSVISSKTRHFSSSSSISSNGSSISLSLRSNRFIKNKLKKIKKRGNLKKSLPLIQKSPDHLKNYQYFEKDDDEDEEDWPRDQNENKIDNNKRNKSNIDSENMLFDKSSSSDSYDDDDDYDDDEDELDSDEDFDESSDEEYCTDNDVDLSIENQNENSSYNNHNHRSGDSEEFFSVHSNQSNLNSTCTNDSSDSENDSSASSNSSTSKMYESDSSSNKSNTSLKNYKPPTPLFVEKKNETSVNNSFRSHFSNLTNTFEKQDETIERSLNIEPKLMDIKTLNNELMDKKQDGKEIVPKLKSKGVINQKLKNDLNFYGIEDDEYENSFDNFYSTTDYNPSTLSSLDFESQSRYQESINQEDIAGSNRTSGKQPEDPYEFNVDETNLNSKIPSQITPPKSAGSILSANPNSNPSTSIPPFSYDDLNNIFEEESSADEPLNSKPSSDPKLTAVVNDFAYSNGVDSKHSYNDTFPLSTPSIMTPPSGELNGLGLSIMTPNEHNEDLVALTNTSVFPQLQISLLSEKALNANDFSKNNSVPNNHLDINSNSYKIFTTIIFDIPLLSNFSRNAKYKRMSLNNNLKKKSKKLKWHLSKNINTIGKIEVKNRKMLNFNKKYLKRKTQCIISTNSEKSKLWHKKISVENLDSDLFNKDYLPYINIQASVKTNNQNSHSDQQNKSFSSQQQEPLAPPLAPPALDPQQAFTPLSKPVNPPTPQHYTASVSSPYFQHGAQVNVQTLSRTLSSSSSYPGSVGAPPSNYQPASVGTPIIQQIQNPASLPPISTNIGGSPLINQVKSVGPPPHTPPVVNKQNQQLNASSASSTSSLCNDMNDEIIENNNNEDNTSVNLNQILKHDKKKTVQVNRNISFKSNTKPNDVIAIKPHKKFKLKPFDQVAQQTHPKSSLNLNFYLNSACFNLNLSDTLLDIYRDINFDSCTLCVCNNNNIYGLDHQIYILNDILNASDLNEFVSAIKNSQSNKDGTGNDQKQASSQTMQTPSQTFMPSNSNLSGNSCTCGFSSVVNRSILSKNALAINLNLLIKLVSKIYDKSSSDLNVIMPYFNLINYLNKHTNPSMRDSQIFIMNSTQCSGLFLEDYIDILNICQPHYLISKINSVLRSSTNNKPVSTRAIAQKLISTLVTSKFLNNILIRENYSWKKSFTYKQKSSKLCQLVSDEKNNLVDDNETGNLLKNSSNAMQNSSKDSIKALDQTSTSLPNLGMMSPNKRISKKQKQQQLQLKINPNLDTSKLEETTKLTVCIDGDFAKKIDINQIDEKLNLKKDGQYELVESYESGAAIKTVSVLELFEQKYSCPFLTNYETHDIFFSPGKQFDFDEDYNADYDKMLSHEKPEAFFETDNQYKKRNLKKKFQLNSLERYDDNNVCKNVIKRLYLKSKSNLKDDSNKTKERGEENDDEESKMTKSYLKNKLKFKSLFAANQSIFTQEGDTFLLHSWLYSKKELKSNLELTKSLKLIQPLLEETVLKKYTSSRMWESFQGPLTWQHFCRLAFRDTNSNKRIVNHHTSNASNSSSLGSNNGSSMHQNGNNNGSGSNNQTSASNSNYEPEPIPALLVSSSDKDSWLTVSPYSIKFWDKLNYEPYSKQKNIAYVVLMPDFTGLFNDLNDSININPNGSSNLHTNSSTTAGMGFSQFDSNSLNEDIFGATNKSNNNTNMNNEPNDQFLTMVQSVKEYFKELNSVYELCKLGIHRPALRIAPDQGFIRVPLNKFKANKTINRVDKNTSNIPKPTLIASPSKRTFKSNTSFSAKKEPVIENPTSGSTTTSDQTNSKLKVDEWFNKIQTHKSTRQLGFNLKSYAKILKSLGDKIATGHTSTITTTIQSNIFSSAIIQSANLSNSNENDDKTKNDSKPNEAEIKAKPPQVAQTFQSTIIPTISSINLDRTIFEEQKPQRNAENTTSNGAMQTSSLAHSSSLSNLLNQPINQADIINLGQTDFSLNHSHTLSGSSSSLGNSGNGQAQILTNFSSSNNSQTGSDPTNLLNQNMHGSSNSSLQNSILQQQQQTLNNLSSGSNLTQITQLTANLTQPPSLVVYIIDPFDFYMYNRVKINKSKQFGNGCSANVQSKTPSKSNNSSFSKINSSKQSVKKKVKDQLTAKTSSNNNESIVASGIKNEPMDQQSDEFKSSNTDHLIEKPNESDNNTENSNTNKSLDKDAFSADIDMTLRDETLHQDDDTHNTSASTFLDENLDNMENIDENDENLNDDEFNQFDEFDLKRLRHLGLFKAYLEFYNQLPDLFKSATQFQVIPLASCIDIQQNATSLYTQSIVQSQMDNSSSNYSNIYSTGYGSSWSDLDMDFKFSFLKTQAFNIFSLSKKFYMSPAHNFYLNLNQQQNNSLRPKSLTGFGPAAAEERFLRNNLLSSTCEILRETNPFSQLKKMQFYSPAFILAPTTITTTAVALAASNLFFKNVSVTTPGGNAPGTSKSNGPLNSTSNTNGGESNALLPHFIQLNMSNSNYGFLNLNNNYNFNLSDLIHQQQHFLTSTTTFLSTSTSSLLSNTQNSSSLNSNSSGNGSGINSNSALSNNIGATPSSSSNVISGGSNSGTTNSNLINSNYLTTQQYQQQCNVLYVAYCLSDDQRFLLTSCSDENGELIESTSISIEVDERYKRSKAHGRRIGLRKLWEFVMAIISQTCKPWRLVIGRLGRMGHSELRGWACLLSKKNLQRVCQQLKDSCETCNILGNMEIPCILSASLISMEGSESICVYPEAFSREDKQAAAALTGQTLVSNHASQAHGVSCTHILTFPASAVSSELTSNIGVGLKDGDMMSKSDPVEDDFFSFFKFEDEDMNELLNENINDKNLNESGANGVDGDQANSKEKIESILNQEEVAHLDQQPLAVGYYVSTARCGPLPKWLRGDVSLESNFHTFKATLHIHNSNALENDELHVKTENSHKLDSPITYEVLRYVLERYNALSWLNIDPLVQDRKSCLPIHHTILLQMYYAFKNYI